MATAIVWLMITLPTVSVSASNAPATPATVSPDAANGQRIDGLLQRLAQNAADRTPFVEQRESSLMTEPVTLRGHLRREPDGTLVRRVESPWIEEARVDRERVVLVRDGRRRSFALGRAPELVDVMTAFNAILAGDREPLTAKYRLSLVESDANWTLQFDPLAGRNPKQSRRVALTVHGRGDQPGCVVTRQSDGTTSRMLIGTATTSRPTIEQGFAEFCADAGH